jgi:hypothetical protein
MAESGTALSEYSMTDFLFLVRAKKSAMGTTKAVRFHPLKSYLAAPSLPGNPPDGLQKVYKYGERRLTR